MGVGSEAVMGRVKAPMQRRGEIVQQARPRLVVYNSTGGGCGSFQERRRVTSEHMAMKTRAGRS